MLGSQRNFCDLEIVYKILILKTHLEEKLRRLCQIEPFVHDRNRHTPAYIIQFIFQRWVELSNRNQRKEPLFCHLISFTLAQVDGIREPRDIATIIHKMGLGFQPVWSYRNGNLKTEITELCMRLVSNLLTAVNKPALQAQTISNTIYGLGKLAEAGAPFSNAPGLPNALSELLKSFQVALPNGTRPAQAIANTLYGLGKLAEAGVSLSGCVGLRNILPVLIENFTQNLNRSDRPTQHIANILYSMGKLAGANVPLSEITNLQVYLSKLLADFIQGLNRSNNPTLEIANTLYGLGKLAEIGIPLSNITNLQHTLLVFLQCFLENLNRSDRPIQHIATTLYSFGKLAEAGVAFPEALDFQSALPVMLRCLNVALQKNSKSPQSTQSMACILYGLGKLVEAGMPLSNDTGLQNMLPTLSQHFIEGLNRSNRPTQEIANTLWALTFLCGRDANIILHMIQQMAFLYDLPFETKHLSQLHHVYGHLLLMNQTNPHITDSPPFQRFKEFYEGTRSRMQHESPFSSRIHKDYLAALNEKLISLDLNEKWVLHSEYYEYGNYIDIAIIGENRKIAIEINGPTHYRSGAASNASSQKNQHRVDMMTALGWTVLTYNIKTDNLEEHIDSCLAALIPGTDDTELQPGFKKSPSQSQHAAFIPSSKATEQVSPKGINTGKGGLLDLVSQILILREPPEERFRRLCQIEPFAQDKSRNTPAYIIQFIFQRWAELPNRHPLKEPLFCQLVSFTRSQAGYIRESRDVATILHKMGIGFQTVWKFRNKDLLGEILDLCIRLISNPMATTNRPGFQSHAIANIIYGLGRLAEAGVPLSNAPDLPSHLSRFLADYQGAITHDNRPTQGIANTLYGLGKLVEAGVPLVNDMTLQNTLSFLLARFQSALDSDNKPTQAITNIISGLSQLIAAGIHPSHETNLQSTLSNLVACFQKALPRDTRPTQAITNIVYSLGKLAEAGVPFSRDMNLQNIIPSLLTHLIQDLNRSDRPTQHIANVLYGMGKLAEASIPFRESPNLQRILSSLLKSFVVAQRRSDRPTQHIANTLYGLGKLIEAGVPLSKEMNLEETLPKLLEFFINNLNRSGKPMQEIINSLYGLGKLAEARASLANDANLWKVIPILLGHFIAGLNQSDRPAQHVANTLYYLGKLVEVGALLPKDMNLQNTLPNLLKSLIEDLDRSDRPAQHIANTLYGMGKLADAGILLPHASHVQTHLSTLLTNFTKSLNQSDKPTQAVANALYGLGKLAETDTLLPQDTSLQSNLPGLIPSFIGGLKRSDRRTQHIANLLYGLGKLAEAGIPLWDAKNPETTLPLPTLLQHFIEDLSQSDRPTQAVANTLWELTFINKRDARIILDMIRKLNFLKSFPFDQKQLTQLHHVYGHLIISAKSDPRITELPEFQCMNELYEGTKSRMQNNSPLSSPTHKEYLTILKRKILALNMTEKWELYSEYYEYGRHLDIAMIGINRKIAIEVNGPSHYRSGDDSHTLTFRSQCRVETLRELGWTVFIYDTRTNKPSQHIDACLATLTKTPQSQSPLPKPHPSSNSLANVHPVTTNMWKSGGNLAERLRAANPPSPIP